MNVTATAHPSTPPQASDLPPEISALIEAAMARAAGSATTRRPVVPVVRHRLRETSFRLPCPTSSKRHVRVLIWCELGLVGLFLGLLLSAWVSVMIGLHVAQAGERTMGICLTPPQSGPSRPAPDREPCDRLPHRS